MFMSPNGFMNQDATWYGGNRRPRRRSDVVLDGVAARRYKTGHSSQFLVHVYRGQTPGTEVDLGPGHTVLDGVPALRERGTAPPSFRPMSIVATVARLSYC